MNTDYREKSSTCSCCGGIIPAGKITWIKSGECPGSVRPQTNYCGAIVKVVKKDKS